MSDYPEYPPFPGASLDRWLTTPPPEDDYDEDEPDAAPAALIGPRKPCRVCGDLSLYGIHPKCEPREIEKERFAMDRDDGRETDHEEEP